MTIKMLCCTSLVLALAAHFGCGQVMLPGSSAQKKLHWKAEDYFTDAKVVALCQAIEANDLAEIDRLIAAGADVNAQGKGKMTPLLWAFFDNKPERFKLLLERGANPNVIVESDFGTRGWIMQGTSVTHMATETAFPGYFEAVFAHGGDPNLEQQTKLGGGETPLFTVLWSSAPNKMERVRLLLAKGADVNHRNHNGDNAAYCAIGVKQFDIVLSLLEAGADYKVYGEWTNDRLIHHLLTRMSNIDHVSGWTPRLKADYEAVIRWLETHGESVEEAMKDKQRWRSWSRDNGEYDRKMAAEVAARMAHEAEEKQRKPAPGQKADP